MDNNLVRLAKLMELTTSENDNEALAALRKANEFRKSINMTWAELLEPPIFPRGVTVTVFRHQDAPTHAPMETPDHLTDKPTIDMMFKTVYSMPRIEGDDFWVFLDSIRKQFDKYGNLSQKQYNALRRSYARCLKRGAR